MKGKLLLIVVIAEIFLFGGCKDPGVITQIEGLNVNVSNSPSVANTQNSFAFNVNANTFGTALEYPISFDKTSFEIAVSITKLTTGDVSIQIYNNSKQMLYNGNFNQNTSLDQIVTLDDTPTKIKLIFNNLSSSFSCSITGK